MAVKPKNVEKDSWAYTLPHEVGFLIQELAERKAQELKLSELSTSDYLEMTIRELAEKLPVEQREKAKRRHEERKQRRLEQFRKAQEKEREGPGQEKAARVS